MTTTESFSARAFSLTKVSSPTEDPAEQEARPAGASVRPEVREPAGAWLGRVRARQQAPVGVEAPVVDLGCANFGQVLTRLGEGHFFKLPNCLLLSPNTLLFSRREDSLSVAACCGYT